MKTRRLINFLIPIGIVFFTTVFVSCQHKTKLVDLSQNEIDSTWFDRIDSKYENPDSTKSFLGIGKGATWRTWRSLHKNCMEAQWFKDPFYFGVSSTVNLGAIVDKDFGLQRLMDSTNGFTQNDLKLIINYGTFSSCNYSEELTMSLKVLVQTEFDFTNSGQSDLTAQLNLAISHNKSTKVKIDSWRINNIQEEKLMDILYDAPKSDTEKQRFLETLRKPGYKILVRVVEVKGFTSSITLETEMSAALEAKLREGVVATMGKTGLEAEFKYKDKKTIEVTCGGDFYVFGQFKKADKVIND